MKDKLGNQSQVNGLPKAHLVVLRGPNIGLSYELGESTRIGRGEESEVQIPDPSVSRLHAEIVRSRMAYVIHDRGSRNGLIVNGQRVREKVLLKNDEILVGNTLLAFNPDLRIENARFSNSTVILYPSDEVTRELTVPPRLDDALGGREKELVEFVMQISDVFAAPPAGTAETARRLVAHFMALFHADFGALLLRDGPSKKLRIAVALPEGKTTHVNRTIVATALEDQRPTLVSERSSQIPRMPEIGSQSLGGAEEINASSSSSPRTGTTTMCAPVTTKDTVIAVVVLAREQLDAYSLRDLALLHALAKMSAGILQAAQLADFLAALPVETQRGQAIPSRNPVMQRIFDEARRVAATDATVLITGESGTGKEVLARLIHETSQRRNGPFVALNCSAIPPNLFESELFGYERGAFTGAGRTTPGKIEAAHGGTLFLDEIGALDPALQPKLLRFLQEKAFYRVGGTRAIETDVRIIAATNSDLEIAVREGRFREDLWYRLNVVRFVLPPLRQRVEDIAPLAEHFAQECARRFGKRILGIDDSALAILQRYSWPGNIRELINAVERAVLLSDRPILLPADFQHLMQSAKTQTLQVSSDKAYSNAETLPPLQVVEREHILRVLRACSWNQARAAEILGIHRNTLRAKILEYGLQRDT